MIGLQELILTHHCRLQPPPTRIPGTHTIDSIFGTPAIDVVQSGYGLFVGFTDHRISWLNIRWDIDLGLFLKKQHLTARCSQSNYPRSVESLLATADIITMVIQLEITVTFSLTPEDTEKYE